MSKSFACDVALNAATVYAAVIRESDGYFLNAADAFVASLPTFPAAAQNAVVLGRYAFTSASTWTDGAYTIRWYSRAGGGQSFAADTLISAERISILNNTVLKITSADIDAIAKAALNGNIRNTLVAATAQDTVRKVDIGRIDHEIIELKRTADADWTTPILSITRYFWYDTLGDSYPSKVGENG